MINIQRSDYNPPSRHGRTLAATTPVNGAGPPPGFLAPRDALVLGSAEPGTRLTAALVRLGLNARMIDYDDVSLSARLLGPRPDLVIIDATTSATERAARLVLTTLFEGLRTLSVPVIAAMGTSGVAQSEVPLLVDDVLLPPHEAAEAVIRAALVSQRRGNTSAHLVSAGVLTVDIEGFRAWLSGEPVTLTYTEFQLLRLLLLNRGKVLTRQMLLNKIWGYDYLGGLRTVDVHIRRLRAKIEAHAPALIETVRHVGYRIPE